MAAGGRTVMISTMSSTRFSRRSLLRAACASAACAALPAMAPAGEARRPNILLIMADDMGFSDIGCYGSEIATPNLDRLAYDGLRCTHFYNTGRCCPTRASLLTGLYPHQTGVGHMVENRGHPSYQGYLNDSCVTIAEAIRPAGYHALMVGKWHVGEKRGCWPFDRGFEHYYGLVSGGSNYFRKDPNRIFAEDDREIDPTGGEGYYLTDDFTRAAVQYIDQYARKPEPFFMYVAYTAPHWPLHARPEDIARYKGRYMVGWDEIRRRRLARQFELGIIDRPTALTPRDPKAPAWDTLSQEQKELADLKMAVYAAQIECMDRGIGRMVEMLKKTGAFDNTLIIFLSDNGGCAEEINRGKPGVPPGGVDSFMSYGLPWANASNTPFRLYKHWVHEGGICSPLIAHWPGRIKPGTITDQIGHVIDFMATCLDLAGAEYPRRFRDRDITPLEGKSLVPVFEGRQRQGHQAVFFEHEGNRAVRQGRWKLVARHNQPWELYDMATDRVELNDLADREPEKVKELAEMYRAWAQRCRVMPWGQISSRKPQA